MSVLFNRGMTAIIGPRGGQGILVTDLRMTFQIERTLEKFPNNAQIEIYNLGRENRSRIEEKRTAILINAGYGDTLKNLFAGDIAQIVTKRSGPDIVTSIEAGDGEVSYNNTKLDISFKPGTTMGQVFDAIRSSFGLSEGTVKGLNESDQFQQGLTLSGSVRDHMNYIARRQNLEWSIQNNQLQILPVDTATDEEVVLLNASTGLVGTPFKTKVVNQSILKKKDGQITDSGIACVSLLNAEIKPGRRIKIESEFITGVFRVHKVKHNGDTHGQQWYSEIEAK